MIYTTGMLNITVIRGCHVLMMLESREEMGLQSLAVEGKGGLQKVRTG